MDHVHVECLLSIFAASVPTFCEAVDCSGQSVMYVRDERLAF